MRRRTISSRRLAACAAAAVLTASTLAGGAFPLPVSADSGPEYEYSLLAGGSRIGMKVYIKAQGTISNVTVDGQNWEDYDAIAGGGGIVVYLPVKAPEMRDTHTISCKVDGTAYTKTDISAAEYLQQLRSDNTYKAIAKAMLEYGFTAEDYFKGKVSYTNYNLDADMDYRRVSIGDSKFTGKEAYNADLEEKNLPYRYYGMNLTLLDEIRFSLYYETDTDPGRAYLTDGYFGGEGTEKYVEPAGEGFTRIWKDVPASQLTNTFTCVHAPAKPVDFSPSQYLAAALESKNEKLTAVCKALYAYGEAARALQDHEPEKWESDTIHIGTLTEYEGGYTGGHAMLDPVNPNLFVTAINLDDYDNGLLAGACLRVTHGGRSIDVVVTDTLSAGDGRSPGDLDMNIDAFKLLTGATTGVFSPIEWQIIPMKGYRTNKLSYKFKEGSNKWHVEMQVRDHTYPVKKVEVIYNGNYVELTKTDYNFFVGDFPSGDGLGTGIYTFRITDIYDQVVEDELEESVDKFSLDPQLTADTIVKGHVQFPA